jgi:hypothetical protein
MHSSTLNPKMVRTGALNSVQNDGDYLDSQLGRWHFRGGCRYASEIRKGRRPATGESECDVLPAMHLDPLRAPGTELPLPWL